MRRHGGDVEMHSSLTTWTRALTEETVFVRLHRIRFRSIGTSCADGATSRTALWCVTGKTTVNFVEHSADSSSCELVITACTWTPNKVYYDHVCVVHHHQLAELV
jgi:hypothetical protein